ncbi:MAG: Uncharacterised protein [Synechococcus sp. MIT S9220]|nr:MAG: Uncharacterised protein [Synechococcus sp. MIT S9220]
MSLGVKLHQVERHLAQSLSGTFLGLDPGRTAHLAELGWSFTVGAITTEAAQLIRRHPQDAVGVLHHQVVTHLAADRQLFQLLETADAVIAMHHEIPRLHFVGIHRATGCLAAAAHIARAGEGLLPKKLAVSDESDPPGGKLQPLEVSSAACLQSNRCSLFNQTLDGRRIGSIGNETTDAVMLFEQRNSSTGLGRQQPNGLFLLAVALDQFTKLSKLIGIGRHRTTVEIKSVGMVITFLQLSQIKPWESFSQPHRLLDVSMQDRQRQRQFVVMLPGMVQPLVPMRAAMTSLINGHKAVGREIVEK